MKKENKREKELYSQGRNFHGESHDRFMLMDTERLKLPFISSPRPEMWFGSEKCRLSQQELAWAWGPSSHMRP